MIRLIDPIKFTLLNSHSKLIYSVSYFIILKNISTNLAELLISIIVISLNSSFFIRSGYNSILIKVKKSENFKKESVKLFLLSYIMLLVIFLPISVIFVSDINLKIVVTGLMLSSSMFTHLMIADFTQFMGDEKKYTNIYNRLYYSLLMGIISFVIIENIMILTLFPIISSILLLKDKINIYNIKNVKINSYYKPLALIWFGNLFNILVNTSYIRLIDGKSLVNFFIGKSIGEFAFNTLGYQFSNYVNKKNVSTAIYYEYKKLLFKFYLAFISIVTIIILLKIYTNILEISSDLLFITLVAILFMINIIPMIINTITTRELQRSQKYLLGTIIGVATNVLTLLLIIYLKPSDPIYLWCLLLIPNTLGTSICFLLFREKGLA